LQVVTILFMNVLVGVILSPFRAVLKSRDTSAVDVKEALIRQPGGGSGGSGEVSAERTLSGSRAATQEEQ
jgi:hypothetical protein